MDDLAGKPSAWSSGCPQDAPHPPQSTLRDEPLYRLFKAVHTVFRQRALQQMRAEGIDALFPGAAPLLLHLGEEEGLTLSELARRCELENSTLTPLVDDLEQHGLVTRTRDPDDRRVVRIYLTPGGRALEPRLRALWLRLQETAFAGISDLERDSLYCVLERIVTNLNKD